MPILKNVLGLDLGSHSLKAVELQQTLRGFQVVQVRSMPREDGEVPLADLVSRFAKLYRLSTDHVISALPGDRISSRRLTFPFRERRKLAQAVPFEVEGDLPFELEDVVIDWEVVGDDRTKADVAVIIAPRSEVSSFLETLREAECEPRTLEAEGLALANLAAVFELGGARLLVDLGHRKTTFCLLVDGRALAARTVPFAGRALTAALAADGACDVAEAERRKCELGLIAPGLEVAGARVSESLDRLAREVVRTLGSVEGVLGARKVSELTLLGGGARLERLDEYLSAKTGIPAARLGYPPEGPGQGFVAGGDPVSFAPAIALALRGTAQARTRMNFRQDEFAPRVDLARMVRPFAGSAWLAGVALLLALASFGVSALLDGRRAARIEGDVARLYSEALPGQPVPEDPVAALRAEVASANERAEFLGVYRGNLSALDLLTEISKQVPADLEIVLEEVSIDRQIIRMRVFSKNFEAADRLGAELAEFPPFARASIGAATTDRKTDGKRFPVTISLAPEEARP